MSGVVRSTMGAFFPGSHVMFRGKLLHQDLKDADWVELYAFGITGRRFGKDDTRLLHAIWAYTSYPDVRIWNNRVAGLAGSSRSTGNLGIAAALAVSDAAIYGRGIDVRAADLLVRARATVDQGADLSAWIRGELQRHRSLAGFGRPVVSADERIAPMLDLAARLGRSDGPHLVLAQEIADILLRDRLRLHINYGAVAAALALDLGFSPTEYYYFTIPAFLAGMPPCHIEAADGPPGKLFALACTEVRYSGAAARSWPPGCHPSIEENPT